MPGKEEVKIHMKIGLIPVTKKNNPRIVVPKGSAHPFIMPSEKYVQYEKDCGWWLKGKGLKIDAPVNVKAHYYMPTRRRVDLTNLHEALHDVLVHYGVLKDDNSNIIVSTDGSRVFYDKENPRTEVWITEAADYEVF